MRIRVDIDPDNPAPRRLHFDGRHIEIVETIDQWYGADYRYLKVRGDDGGLYILHFNESRDEWALIMYRRAIANALRPSAQ
jgi:hypothetical protein